MPVVQERITEITEMDESKAAAFLGEESMHSPMIRDHRSSTITQGFRSWFAVQAVRPQRQGDITAEEKKKKKGKYEGTWYGEGEWRGVEGLSKMEQQRQA